MSLSRRINSQRLSNPPRPCPKDPVLVPMSEGIMTETPPPRPIPHSNISARSVSSTGSSTDNDTIFDLSHSRSQTPTSPLTPGEISLNVSNYLSFSNEGVSQSTVRFLAEPPLDRETAGKRLYEILSEVAASIHDTPSKRKIDASKQQWSHISRIPGRFESQDTDTDMGVEYFSSDPATSLDVQSAQCINRARQILGDFADVSTVTSLMPRAHQLRSADWKFLTNIYKEHKEARHDLQHLIQVLRIRTHNHSSLPKPLIIPEPARTTEQHPEILNFVPWKPKKQQRQINNNIYKCMRNQEKSPKGSIKTTASKPKQNLGWVYVFESPVSAPGKVKIGKTDSDPQKRRADWEKCGVKLIEVEDSCRNAFDHYSVVESLTKFELHNERRKYKCYHEHHAPKKWVEHEEWFEIDKEKALNSVRRWRDWVKNKGPLNQSGLLTPYWHWRVQKLPKSINDINWDIWTQPSLLDYIDYQLEEFGKVYYTRIRAHLYRKDSHFCLTGGLMMAILYTLFGMVGAIWSLLALLIL